MVGHSLSTDRNQDGVQNAQALIPCLRSSQQSLVLCATIARRMETGNGSGDYVAYGSIRVILEVSEPLERTLYVGVSSL